MNEDLHDVLLGFTAGMLIMVMIVLANVFGEEVFRSCVNFLFWICP